MKKLLFTLLASSLFISCGITGTNFYIRNYEDKPVNVQYNYSCDKGMSFDFAPQLRIACATSLLDNNQLNSINTDSNSNFDKSCLFATKIDSTSFEVSIPAKATLRIDPVYIYENNLAFSVLDKRDTIAFNKEGKIIKSDAFKQEKILKVKHRLIGNGYSVLNLRLKKIRDILNE